MPISVKDIFKLDTLEKLELVAGNEGLQKEIEWIYVAECFENPLEGIKWIQGGELVFISGVGIKGDIDVLIQLIQGIVKKNGVGLIVNIGKYIKSIPDKAIEIANKLEFPLFILPWEVKLVEVSKEISNAIILSRVEENSLNQFLNNMLFGDGLLEVDPIEKAASFGYNLEGKCYISLIKINVIEEFLKIKNMYDDKDIEKIRYKFRRVVNETLRRNGLRVPIIEKDHEFIILNKAEENLINKLERSFREIQDVVNKDINGLSISVGVGNCYQELKLMKQSLKESELAIECARCQGLKDIFTKYNEMGLYALLYGVNNKNILKDYYSNVLGKIIENAKNAKDITSIKILETYLNENCSITNTAEKLFMHRNTLKYRIKKIEERLQCDLHDFDDCIKLKMALDISKMIT
jgi:sugar diacid utilization regulator